MNFKYHSRCRWDMGRQSAPGSDLGLKSPITTRSFGDEINRDPVQEWGGLNLYGFVSNSPFQFLDSFGLWFAADDLFTGPSDEAFVGGIALVGFGLAAGYMILNPPTDIIYPSPHTCGQNAAPSSVTSPTSIPSTIIESVDDPPFEGEPGTTVRGPTKTRQFGDDGFPATDRELPHPDHKPGSPGASDHVHDWGRPHGGERPTHKDRGPDRFPTPEDPPAPRGPGVPPPSC